MIGACIFKGKAPQSAPTATAVTTAAQTEKALVPLAKQVSGVADDALVHFAPEGHGTIKPGAGGEVHALRYGDINHLPPRQVETIIGPMARGGEKGGAKVMHVLDAEPNAAMKVDAPFPEYIFKKDVPVKEKFTVQDPK